MRPDPNAFERDSHAVREIPRFTYACIGDAEPLVGGFSNQQASDHAAVFIDLNI
jgi:hypothetical protein